MYLLKHIYSLERIPKPAFKILVPYLAGLQGKSLADVLQQAQGIADGTAPIPDDSVDVTEETKPAKPKKPTKRQKKALAEAEKQGLAASTPPVTQGAMRCFHVIVLWIYVIARDIDTAETTAEEAKDDGAGGDEAVAAADAKRKKDRKRQLKRAHKLVEALSAVAGEVEVKSE